MKNRKNSTRKALLMSVLSMLLCCTMLVGTTFAWFTDTVTTGVNRIVAGNLDVELEYLDADGEWQKVTEETKLFSELEADGETKNLWEPGHTEVVYLRISNAGTLALKYQFAVTPSNETKFENVLGDKDCVLSDYLVFGQEVSENEIKKYASREDAWKAAGDAVGLKEFKKSNEKLLPDKAEYVALIVYMPTTVGNDANYRGEVIPSIDLGITLLATQTPHEEDSFGADYDENAEFVKAISDTESLITALQNSGTYELTEDIAVDETIKAAADTEITLNLNGHNLDASKNTSRPIEVSNGTSLTINGDNETVTMGAYGLVNIPADVYKTTITVNGGNYVGKTNNGCMIKPRGVGEVTVNLNNVTVKDDSTNGSCIINTGDYHGNITVTVNGGSYTGYRGFHGGANLVMKNVTMNMKHWAVYNYESDAVTVVDGCNITVTNEGTPNDNANTPNACIAASGNATIEVKNSTLTNETGNATSIYTSGGNIELENCQITGKHTHYHGSGEYPLAEFSTTIDGEAAEVEYPNCPNGCKTYNH